MYKKNEELGKKFREYIIGQISDLKLPASVQGISSMCTIAFGCYSFKKGIKLEQFDGKAYSFFIEEMAKRHVLLPPLPTETIFLSPVHETVFNDIEIAIKESLNELKNNYYLRS